MKIHIVFQNDDFLAVDKPTGLSIHNHEDPTNLLKEMEKQLGTNKIFPPHRLDKETSGLQLLALNESAAKKLGAEFQNINVKKTYVGIVCGQLKEDEGGWDAPLTDSGEGRKNPAGLSEKRVPCKTKFKVIKKSQYFTLVEFDLITGRQHQIRKHCVLAGHALVGDPRYGNEKYNKKITSLYKTDRMFLHCLRMVILDISIESAIPSEFEQILGQ